MRTFLFAAGLAAFASLIACSTTNEEVGSSEAQVTEARTLGVVKGRELARCWFDRVGDDEQLSCTSTARGNDPLTINVRAVITGSAGFSKTLDVEAGGTNVVGSISANSFGADRSVELQAYLGWEDRHMLGLDEGDWSARQSSADPSKITKENPLVIREPFDFWEIGTVYALTKGGGYSFTAHAYERDIDPYRAGLAGKKVLAFTPDIASDPGKTTFIVAPKEQGPLAITWSHDGQTIETSITGPGYYALADDGIRPATPEEILASYGAPAPVNTIDAGPTNTSDAGPATDTTDAGPPPPPAWVDPDPTCGGNAQARCADQSCDPGTRWDGFQRCESCGANGEPYCYVDPKGSNASQGKKCDPGTRWDGYQRCETCGANGQPYCYADPNNGDPSTGRKCNPGTRWDGYQRCETCGGLDQPYCYADANGADPASGKKCNDGLRVDFNRCAK